MGEIYDLKQGVLSLKAEEEMLGFAGFEADVGRNKEGIAKFSGFYRDDGSGYLTVTFVIDTKDDPYGQDQLRKAFSGLDERALRHHLGDNLEMMMAVPLDSLSVGLDWFIGEWNIYFKKLRGRKRDLIQRELLPALGRILPFTFDTVQWWSEISIAGDKKSKRVSRPKKTSRLNSLLCGWLGE